MKMVEYLEKASVSSRVSYAALKSVLPLLRNLGQDEIPPIEKIAEVGRLVALAIALMDDKDIAPPDLAEIDAIGKRDVL